MSPGVQFYLSPDNRLPAKIVRPAPGPAVVQFSLGAPLVVVADQFHDVVGFSFSPTPGFGERFRTHDPARFMPRHRCRSSSAVPWELRELRQRRVWRGNCLCWTEHERALPARGMSPIVATPTRLAGSCRTRCPGPGLPLVHLNDTRCRSVAGLRSAILKARRLAGDDAEREQASAAVKTWLLAQIEKKRAAPAAEIGGRPPNEPFAPERLAA